MIYAFFLNHGTLIINGEPPFNVAINDFKNINCLDTNCQTTLAPGNYTLTFKKEGYKDLVKDISIPIGGQTKVNADLEFIPYLSQLDPTEAVKIFTSPTLSDAQFKQLPTKTIFYDQQDKPNIAYINVNPDNNRQTLYTRSFQESGSPATTGSAPGQESTLGPEKMVTSFQRELQSYNIIPDLEDRQKIALIDYTSGQSTLYLIDLKKKTRSNILTMPFIKTVKWLPNSEDLLLEGKAEGDLVSSIFLYSASAPQSQPQAQTQGQIQSQLQKLDLKTGLNNVVAISKDRLIAATNQQIQTSGDPAKLEGMLVVLGENQASPDAGTGGIGIGAAPANSVDTQAQIQLPAISLIDYSLVGLQGRLLKTSTTLFLPKVLKISMDKKSVYFYDDNNAYELHLAA